MTMRYDTITTEECLGASTTTTTTTSTTTTTTSTTSTTTPTTTTGTTSSTTTGTTGTTTTGNPTGNLIAMLYYSSSSPRYHEVDGSFLKSGSDITLTSRRTMVPITDYLWRTLQWSSIDNALYFIRNSNQLIKSVAGVDTVVGTIAGLLNVRSMAIRQATNEAYIFVSNSSDNEVYSLDLTNATTALVKDYGTYISDTDPASPKTMQDTTFDADGNLYAVESYSAGTIANLIKLSTADWSVTTIGSYDANYAGGQLLSIDNVLYSIRSTGGPAQSMNQVSKSDGAFTFIGNGVFAGALDPAWSFWGATSQSQ